LAFWLPDFLGWISNFFFALFTFFVEKKPQKNNIQHVFLMSLDVAFVLL
jgi:hypothetical protein